MTRFFNSLLAAAALVAALSCSVASLAPNKRGQKDGGAYFGPQGRHGRLIGRALEGLERVEHEVLGSEFEALWREGRLLRELAPPCNRRGGDRAGQRDQI